MRTFFESGKDTEVKGEEWVPYDIVGLYPLLPLWLLGYGNPLPFTYDYQL